MKPSLRCAAFIKSYEQCAKRLTDGRFISYKPTPNDVWTIGWGSTGRDVTANVIWTQAQCDTRFDRDLAMFSAGVDHMLGGAPTTQNQFDAMVSFAYNVGLDDDDDTLAEGLGDSTLLRLHKAGKFDSAALEFAKWNKQKGKVLNGLTRRREAEAIIYRSKV